MELRANRKTRNLDYFAKTVLDVRRKRKGDIWGQIGDADALSDDLYRLLRNYTHLSPDFPALSGRDETLIKHQLQNLPPICAHCPTIASQNPSPALGTGKRRRYQREPHCAADCNLSLDMLLPSTS